jgi:hypothetical protein
MKKLLISSIASMMAVFAFAQDKVINDANAEVRNASGFHAIKVSQGITLIIKQGNTEAVAVSASEKQYRDRIKTEVVNGELKIYYESEKWYKGWNTNNKKLRAYVSFKQLDLLDGSSGSETSAEGSISSDNLKIDLSSGAGFKGLVQATSLSVKESSGATAGVSGKTQSLKVISSSGAVFNGYDLLSDKCEADASSGGTIQVSVSKELAAGASSGGDIHYKGAGVITKINTSSGGSVKSRN